MDDEVMPVRQGDVLHVPYGQDDSSHTDCKEWLVVNEEAVVALDGFDALDLHAFFETYCDIHLRDCDYARDDNFVEPEYQS